MIRQTKILNWYVLQHHEKTGELRVGGSPLAEVMHAEQLVLVGPGVDGLEAGTQGEGAEFGDRVFV